MNITSIAQTLALASDFISSDDSLDPSSTTIDLLISQLESMIEDAFDCGDDSPYPLETSEMIELRDELLDATRNDPRNA